MSNNDGCAEWVDNMFVVWVELEAVNYFPFIQIKILEFVYNIENQISYPRIQ
jgi:hypothetical protein